MKSFLFVMRTSAYSSNRVQEILDVILITAAFDQQVSLLLLDDAVFHLKKNQQGGAIGGKDISAVYRSLKLYDIENIYVEQESLAQRGLSNEDLLIPVRSLIRSDIASLCSTFDFVING